MSSTDVINAPPQTIRLRVPAGAANALCQLGPTLNGTISATVEVRGGRIEIEAPAAGTVLIPTDVGLTLLSALNADPGLPVARARALDIGCGSGLYTVALASAGAAHVTALDVNPACAEVTRDNASRNGIPAAQVATIVGDLAEMAVSEPWDLVVCNPPHFPHDPAYAADDGIEAALVGGSDGRALYDVLLARLDELLAPGGTLLLTHSSLTNIPHTRQTLRRNGYECRTVQICELDIPMRRYAKHRDVLLSRLYPLRAAERAAFRGLRFEVHTLAATRIDSLDGSGE
ncbi:methyltransferase domain-containing protein [Micromonospora sp. NPDC049282]|uniref:methyltransferase domain-containing protein n=1 Tax=Micromonospora sp. NPDC049282 TaxID=3364269 RepID=UPI0037231AC9